MAATVAEAIAALQGGDAAPLALVMAQHQVQQRKRVGDSKRKGRKKGRKSKKMRLADNSGDEDEEEDEEEEDEEGDIGEEVRTLPGKTLDGFYPAAIRLVTGDRGEDEDGDRRRYLKGLMSIAQFTALLVENKEAAVNKEHVFEIAQELHDRLLRLRGDADQAQQTQEAIALLCEACWKNNFYGMAHSLVTQLLPYLIVRAYESPAAGNFKAKKHHVRRLFAIKDALLLLDFDDDSSGLLRDILLRCFIQPNLFRSPDAVPFLSFLFGLHLPFIEDINETVRNQIPNQRRSILKKYGNIYFKAWVASKGEYREKIEEECIQRYINDAVHASSVSHFASVRSVVQIFFENKRHTGVDEMLYRICSPILWRGVKAANDSVRRQAAILLFDNFPLRDPQFNNEMMDLSLQKQFDAFEGLLGDSHPAVRVAAIQGVAKVLSVYWELLPSETIRCFVSKLVVDLVNDVSSSSVRAAVFEGLQFILDNHNSHSILKPLLPMLAPLLNDRNEKVRAEFAGLLVRIKSIRNLHFYDVVPVNDLLSRMVLDRECPLVRKQLVSLFLNSYFPQSVGGSSQVARCLALVKKNPEAAMVFYGSVADQVSVGSVCKLAALLLRVSINFVSKRLKQPAEKNHNTDDDEDEDEDDEEEGFGILGQVVVLEVIGSLLKSVHDQVMTDDRYAECKSFLGEQFNVQSLEALLVAYSEDRPYDQEALSSVWRIVGYLGELTEGSLLEHLVENLMQMDESSSRKLLESMIDCLSKWGQLPFLVSKLTAFLLHWKENAFTGAADPTSKAKKSKKAAATFNLNPVVVLGAVEHIAQSSFVRCPTELLEQLSDALEQCVAPILEFDEEEVSTAFKVNGFGLLRLLEIYARLSVTLESSKVSDKTSKLFAKPSKSFSTKDELLAHQPAELFTPPDSLAVLFRWVARLLGEIRSASDSESEPKATKKKRRRGKDDEEAPQLDLLGRWRNLFSLVCLLGAESIAFAFERKKGWEEDGPADKFVDAFVAALCDALEDAKEHFERVVFFQASQFLHLLETARATAGKANKPVSLRSSLSVWTGELLRALEQVHEDNEAACADLWAVVSPTIQHQQPVAEAENENAAASKVVVA